MIQTCSFEIYRNRRSLVRRYLLPGALVLGTRAVAVAVAVWRTRQAQLGHGWRYRKNSPWSRSCTDVRATAETVQRSGWNSNRSPGIGENKLAQPRSDVRASQPPSRVPGPEQKSGPSVHTTAALTQTERHRTPTSRSKQRKVSTSRLVV